MSNESEFIEYLTNINIHSKREYDKEYYKRNRKKKIEVAVKWQKDHKEYSKEYKKNWLLINSERIPSYNRKYRENNREEILKRNKESYNNNPNKFIRRVKEYNKTEKGKVTRQRVKARRRDLGFKPLNNYFEGSEAHHLDETNIIYIPKEVHQSIWHCLETGENMKEINSYAMNYILMVEEVK